MAAKNRFFGFEKLRVTRFFGFGKNRVGNPSANLAYGHGLPVPELNKLILLTYLVHCSLQASSRYAELDHVDWWAQNNNLRLSLLKLIHRDRKRKPPEHHILPLQIPEFAVSPLSRSSESL